MPMSPERKREYMHEYYRKNREKRLAYNKVYWTKHRVREIARNRRWQANNQARTKRNMQNWRMKTFFGIDLDTYHRILKSQNGVCLICHKPNRHKTAKVSLAVDHDHRCCPGKKSCGKCIRGLLCNRCNLCLGWFEDNRESIFVHLARGVE